MSKGSVEELVRRRREEYEKAGKADRGRLLDELVNLTDYHRKSLVRLLGRKEPRKAAAKRPGPASRYALVRGFLRTLWIASYFACGKRLQPFIPELLEILERHHEIQVPALERELLLCISAATIDRVLATERGAGIGPGRSMTKPGTLLRRQIEVRTAADWPENEPGYLEVDLVAHCGDSGAGEFLYSLNVTDVCTGWVGLGAMRGKGQAGTVRALETAGRALPFAMKGIDSDNGSEFINGHVVRYCKDRGIKFTRGRPYEKNDQCYVEQKNWTVVRQFVGYRRLETDEQLKLVQQLEALVVRYHNFYRPSMHLLRKTREGSKVKRVYDDARTPYRRLMAIEGAVTGAQREALEAEYERGNPIALLRQINALQDKLEVTCRRQALAKGGTAE